MKKFYIKNQKRFALTVMAIVAIPTIIFQSYIEHNKTETIYYQTSQPTVTLVQNTKKTTTPSRSLNQQFINYERTSYINYMAKFGLSPQRAQFILDSIQKTNTNIPTSLILAMIQKETKFQNILTNSDIEDSAGYVQMKSQTIEYLKNRYPSLPTIKSQQEFLSVPEAQIKYMVKYLEIANDKFDGDFRRLVSSYNMGLDNTKLNMYYVNEVAANKEAIEKLIYQI